MQTQPPSTPASPASSPRRWTASELRKLPPAERDAILRAAAEEAEPLYRNDPELTAFEAFDDVEEEPQDGEEHGGVSGPGPR